MTVFKKLSILVCVSLGVLYSDVEKLIQQNEAIITILQEKLDSASSKKDKKDEILTDALQSRIDSLIEEQNKLVEQKATGKVPEADSDSTTKLRHMIQGIVQEELAKAGVSPKPGSPYDTTHVPTPAELAATNAAQKNAPTLPEQKSEAMAQYELALELYNKKAYKEATASFSRIIKAYKTDPIAAKAMVHLAYCFEKQDRLEDASIVCNAALQEALDDPHQVDCQFICLRFAKSKDNDADIAKIVKSLKSLPLTAEQQQDLAEMQGKKTTAPAPLPAKTLQPSAPAKVQPAKVPDNPATPKAKTPAVAATGA